MDATRTVAFDLVRIESSYALVRIGPGLGSVNHDALRALGGGVLCAFHIASLATARRLAARRGYEPEAVLTPHELNAALAEVSL